MVFYTLDELLFSMELGFEDLRASSTPRKLHGLKTLTVFGRALTNVLQNLRHKEQRFDAWYEKYQDEMSTDSLMKYFYELRTVILKKAVHEIGIRYEIKRLDIPGDLLKAGNRPDRAKGVFISGNGVGWIIECQDGSTERQYVQLPPDNVSMTLLLPNAPERHLQQDIQDRSTENLCRLYIDYLKGLVESARKEFGGG